MHGCMSATYYTNLIGIVDIRRAYDKLILYNMIYIYYITLYKNSYIILYKHTNISSLFLQCASFPIS